MASAVDGAANVAKQGTGLASKLFKFGRNTFGVLALSTAFAVATGGVSLAADPTVTAVAAEAAGASVAATSGTINIGMAELGSMTVQGLQHNLGLAISGLELIPGIG